MANEMESASGPGKGASLVGRSEESVLAHSLGNAVAVLFFDLDAMRLARENEEEFRRAHDSMREELRSLKLLVGRVNGSLLAKGKSMPAADSPDAGGAEERASSRVNGAAGSGMKSEAAVSSEREAAIRVLCVDDKADITDGLKLIIDAEPDMQCVGSLASADRLLAEVDRLCREASSEGKQGVLLVLMDASMPGKDPLNAMGEVAGAVPQARMIVYSGFDGPEIEALARARGAWRCISKHEDPATLLRMLREVATASRPAKSSSRTDGK